MQSVNHHNQAVKHNEIFEKFFYFPEPLFRGTVLQADPRIILANKKKDLDLTALSLKHWHTHTHPLEEYRKICTFCIHKYKKDLEHNERRLSLMKCT